MNLTYDSASTRSPALNELLELWRYRDLLRLLILSRIKTRYKRSALGVLWTLLNPLLNTLVLTIAFSQLLRFDVNNYPIYILVGLIFWNFFSQTTNDAMHTLVWGSSLIKRIYIPRTVFAISVVGNGLVNFFLALLPLLVIMIVLHQPVTTAFLFLPLAILIMSIFTLGFALLVSTLAVFFVDFVDMFSIVLSAWFYLTPIIYPLSIIPEKFLAILRFNPLIPFLELFRSAIYQGTTASIETWLISLVMALVSILIGWWVFTKKVDELAYRL